MKMLMIKGVKASSKHLTTSFPAPRYRNHKEKLNNKPKHALSELEVIHQDQVLTPLLEGYSLTGWAYMDCGLPFEFSISRQFIFLKAPW